MLEGKKAQVRRRSATPTGGSGPQKQVRLSRRQQEELVQRHREGTFKKELARVYGVHVVTVRAIIRRAEPQP